ncbi:25S rRNA (adenine2142-N1)-methyltransferase [Taxawa tesnikishii (nom. ined.)]|nr:25S rRNA (adenine2142-N1)-methyltransferase [Dothideales sp. JES 119]
MATSKKKRQKSTSLSHGRPPAVHKPAASLSSKATRTLIRGHHQLNKALASAVRAGDEEVAASLRKQIEERGGLKSYQQASIQGQSDERGGDTSRVLLDWLREPLSALKNQGFKLRMLEVGSLSVSNACSKSGFFDVARIDLNSQSEGIEQQDFMMRPLPRSRDEAFDIISLSLVVNYVPDAPGRGQMLQRTCQFLRRVAMDLQDASKFAPSLFLVLPAPCVTNSRYVDEALLTDVMNALGYTSIQRKLTSKLIYYLWRFDHAAAAKRLSFPKREVNPGPTRNNFSITFK